ncbi:MAG: SemiSWEET family sugar transporter [Pyrinomonadaceae bacterium]
MDWTKFLGLFAGFCTTVSVIPQLYKTWETKSVEDVSIKMFSVLTIGLIMWTVYGILNSDLPIIITNGISTTFNFVMIIFYFKYK